MSFSSPIVAVVVGVIALVLAIGIVARYFSPEARVERRRRKSNYRVVNKGKRPSVTLNVRAKKE